MRPSLFLVFLFLSAGPATAGQATAQDMARALTAADYARAERQLEEHTEQLVLGGTVEATWGGDGRFWYRTRSDDGVQYVLVSPEARTREPAFDHGRMVSALGAATGGVVDAGELPQGVLDLDVGEAIFELDDARFACEISEYRCAAFDQEATRRRVPSPDGAREAFIRDHDLWVREIESGEETRLTSDGQEDFGYATDNAGWARSERPVLAWSPDSRKIATFQHDARGVGMMYLTTTNVGHPELEAWRYPLPGDSLIFRIQRVVIDLDAEPGARVIRLDMPPDPHRSTVCDHVFCNGTFADVEWSHDSGQLAFVSSSRDHKRATLRVADARTGRVRDVVEERVETFYESGYRTWNWRFLPESSEMIWYSQRDDWGHLYLYDLETGELKRQITSGSWNVLEVLQVDEESRTILFVGNEREAGDPYFRYLYRVGMDGSGLELLTPDSADHTVSLAPDGDHFVDSWSTPVIPSMSVLRDLDGDIVMELEEGDVSRLVASGWQAPIPFEVKARDDVTDLYGLMFRPSDFDASETYPVINYLYPGPQSGSVGSRSFRSSHRDLQSLAELGFVVVELDAMGTPMRSKSFHEAYYGNMGDNGLPDQIGGIRQLADRHVWMDLDRVGIFGHSGGGFASADAIMRYPDFYKVAVSQAGNHDNRNYEDDWGEKWQGLLEARPDGSTNYDNQANQLLAENLRGKLLIAHGTLDDNVPASNTMLVVDALIEANKEFDLVLFPNRRHGFGNEPYMMRRRWDYFVRHLLGAAPPPAYEFGRTRLVG